MDKNILTKTLFGVEGCKGRVILDVIVQSTGTYIAVKATETMKLQLRYARKMAKLQGTKEGDQVINVYNNDFGIPDLCKRFRTDVSVYKLVSVKNGKYELRYVGTRSCTSTN